MEIEKYLQRINYVGSGDPDYRELHELQKLYLLSVPFENLDIHCGIPIELDPTQFYDKIVTRQRGGFCYELNGLFYELLRSLGFEVRLISARVFENDKFSEDFDHLALIVSLDQTYYLVDVGFGEFATRPINVFHEEIHKDERGEFSIKKEGDLFTVVKVENNVHLPQYRFSIFPCHLDDFKERCRFHQKDKSSHFTQQKMISLATRDGRITLTDRKLKITENEKSKEMAVNSLGDFNFKLKQYFHIDGKDFKWIQ